MRKLRRWVKVAAAGMISASMATASFNTMFTRAADTATAAVFRVEKIEGTATAISGNGKNLTITDQMQLYSGDSVQTDKKSYAYISLDDSKVLKTEELSKVSIQKRGKKLELGLDEGSMYFEVKEKLKSDESMVIKSSTMSMSIRGTTGIVTRRDVDGDIEDTFLLLEGMVEVDCEGGEPFMVWGGEKVTFSEKEGSVDRTLLSAMDIPGYAGVEIQSNPDLMNTLLSASGIDSQWIEEKSGERLEADQKINGKLYANVFTEEAQKLRKQQEEQWAKDAAKKDTVKKDTAALKKNTQTTTNPANPTNQEEPSSADLADGAITDPTIQPNPVVPPGGLLPNQTPQGVIDQGGSPGGSGGGGTGGSQGGSGDNTQGGDNSGGSVSENKPAPSEPSTEEPTTEEPTTEEPTTEEPTTEEPSTEKLYSVNFWDTWTELNVTYKVPYGTCVTPPDSPVREGYSFQCWNTDDYKNVTRDLLITPFYQAAGVTLTYHTVRYYADNILYCTQRVPHSGEAPLPTPPSKEGYKYTGWNFAGDGNQVMNDMDANAIYEKVTEPETEARPEGKWLVEWVDYNGNRISVQYVDDGVQVGDIADSITSPSREGYAFIGWSVSDNTIIDKDTVIIAQYSKQSDGTAGEYTIEFRDYYGKTVSTLKASAGESLTPPDMPQVVDGCQFEGWNSNAYLNVSGDAVITPKYVKYVGTYAISEEETTTADTTPQENIVIETTAIPDGATTEQPTQTTETKDNIVEEIYNETSGKETEVVEDDSTDDNKPSTEPAAEPTPDLTPEE